MGYLERSGLTYTRLCNITINYICLFEFPKVSSNVWYHLQLCNRHLDLQTSFFCNCLATCGLVHQFEMQCVHALAGSLVDSDKSSASEHDSRNVALELIGNTTSTIRRFRIPVPSTVTSKPAGRSVRGVMYRSALGTVALTIQLVLLSASAGASPPRVAFFRC